MKTAYVLISPCKDEARYVERTLASIDRQTIRPTQWVIVDDGSVDDGMAIVERWRARMPFIKVVRRDSGARQVGGGVVRAFYDGLAAVDVHYDFLCKFDVDLEMPPRYFEVMLERMAADPRLGTCSGKTFYRHPKTGASIVEVHGDEQSTGPCKFYRRECFEAIGGFEFDVGWDAYDCHKARWMGWRAQSWDDPEIRFEHLRLMGSSQKSIYHGRVRHGRGAYLLGSHPLFFCLAAARRAVTQRPYVTGAMALAYGYFQAAATRAKRHGDADIIRFVQRFQLRALIEGKRAAAERVFQERLAALGGSAGLRPQPPSAERKAG
jgi:glycosyltransferase involved in cell wall biosynthesis